MNIFFVIGDEIVTPALQGSILPGITRDSVLQLGRMWGLKATERRIGIGGDPRSGKLQELRLARRRDLMGQDPYGSRDHGRRRPGGPVAKRLSATPTSRRPGRGPKG
jgi:hypothetical protein